MCEGRITGELPAREATQEADHAAGHAARSREGGVTRWTTHEATHSQHASATPTPTRRDRARQARLFGPATRQKLLAFASLIVLMVFFSFASPSFLQTDNMVGILQATAVNGVLAIACTFVIITGGIDLSVGTLMTFCAVMAGVFLTYWGLPLPVGIVAAIVSGALCGFVSGIADRAS